MFILTVTWNFLKCEIDTGPSCILYMYVCRYVCMYACMYVQYVCVCMYVCMG